MRIALLGLFGLVLAGCQASLPFLEPENAEEYEPYWRAARDCFLEATVVMHDAVLDLELTSLDALVWGEDKLKPATKQRLLELSERGTKWAERAVSAQPDGVEGHAWLALNLAMGVAGRTRTRAFFLGLPRRIRKEYTRALELDRAALSGGVLRLRGKFETLAPWPYRDHASAIQALEESLEVAPVPMSALQLGDVHHLSGNDAEAQAAWERARDMPPHQTTRFLNDRVREMARRRLELVEKR